MAIAIQCPQCGKSYRLGDQLAGKRVKCGCGHAMMVPKPQPTTPADALDPALPATGGSNPLWDDALPPTSEGLPDMSLPDVGLAAGPTVPSPGATGLGPVSQPQATKESEAPKKKKKKRDTQRMMIMGIVGAGVVGAILVVVLLIATIVHVLRPGFTSPNEVFAAYQESLEKKDWEALFEILEPASQDKLATVVVGYALAMAEGSPRVRQVLSKHSGQEIAPPAEAEVVDFQARAQQLQQQRQQLAAAIQEKPVFFAELAAAIEADQEEKAPRNPVLKAMLKKPEGRFRRMLARAEMTDLQVEGDTARGVIPLVIGEDKIDAPIVFKNVSGRWYLHVENADEFVAEPVGETFMLALGLF